jgi:hypothetical protein
MDRGDPVSGVTDDLAGTGQTLLADGGRIMLR